MDVSQKLLHLYQEKRELEERAEATQMKAQEAQTELQDINKDFLKVTGAIEALEAMKEE